MITADDPEDTVTIPLTENTSAANELMSIPAPAAGIPVAPAEADKSPVTQLPDAEPVVLTIWPKRKPKTYPHVVGGTLAEVNPLPPSPAELVLLHSTSPVGGDTSASAETVARAKGAPNRRTQIAAKTTRHAVRKSRDRNETDRYSPDDAVTR
jgi:hypothetical protein